MRHAWIGRRAFDWTFDSGVTDAVASCHYGVSQTIRSLGGSDDFITTRHTGHQQKSHVWEQGEENMAKTWVRSANRYPDDEVRY